MSEKVWQPDDVLSFGKNAGQVLKDIYQYTPSYIEWLILNIEGFIINIEKFNKLPNPTPIEPKYKPRLTPESHIIIKQLGTQMTPKERMFLHGLFFGIVYNSSVESIKKVLIDGIVLLPFDYSFPEEVKQKNQEKLEKFKEELTTSIDRAQFDSNQCQSEQLPNPYSKYNGYNRYSDHGIDDVFDGDPFIS